MKEPHASTAHHASGPKSPVHIVKEQTDESGRMHNATELSRKSFTEMGKMLRPGEVSSWRKMCVDQLLA